MNKTPDSTSQKIRDLNDALRQRGTGGRIVLTAGIQALGQTAVNEIVAAIRTFSAFTPDNDPYGEHDFAAITVNGTKIYYKIDYYDRDLQYQSPDPTNPAITIRVMTIMLACEY